MSEKNRNDTAALIRRYYERFNAGDVDGFLDMLADDIAHDVGALLAG